MRFLILQQVMQGRYYETAKKCLWCSWISKVWPQDHQCNRQRPWLPTPLVGPTTSNRKHDLSHPHHYQSLQRENDVFATGTNIRENKRPEVKRAIEYYPCAHLELMKQKKTHKNTSCFGIWCTEISNKRSWSADVFFRSIRQCTTTQKMRHCNTSNDLISSAVWDSSNSSGLSVTLVFCQVSFRHMASIAHLERVNFPTSYSEDGLVVSQSGHRLSWLKFFLVYPSASNLMLW